MYQNVNLNLLKYFYEVVNVQNITKASQNLCVSQPAVTKSLKELEEQVNTKLLERSQKGVIPTPEGEILYNHIKNMFEKLNTTFHTIENNKQKKEHLYIGATTTNFLEFTKHALITLKEKYPNIHIDIVLESREVLLEKSRLGKLDILIKNQYEQFENFNHVKSFTIQDKFIASRKFFSHLENKTLSLEGILEHPTVLLSNITHGRKNFDSYLKSKNINYTPTYNFNSYSLCKDLIQSGFGIGIGNPIHYLDNPDFFILNTDFELPIRNFEIGYIKNSKNKLIHIFLQHLK